MYPGRGDIHRQLADGNVDAADTLITDTQNPFGVGGHQQVDLVAGQPVVAQRVFDILRVVDRQVHPARPAVFVAVAFDRLAHGRGVDDRQHLLDVIGEQPIEEHLVAVPQIRQVHVLGQIVGLAAILSVNSPYLALQCGHTAGQQTLQAQRPPLVQCERRTPVEHGIGQHRATAGADPYAVALGRGAELVRCLVHGASLPIRRGYVVGRHRSLTVRSNASAGMPTVPTVRWFQQVE